MIISKIETFPLRIPFKRGGTSAAPTAWGDKDPSAADSLLVKVTTDQGLEGWGEAFGFHTPKTIAEVNEAIPDASRAVHRRARRLRGRRGRGGGAVTARYDRDLIGYGPKPPDPKWPNRARLAVNFVVNYEEGSEPSVQDGEDYSEAGLTEAHGLNQVGQGRDLAAESMFEYGSRVGFWRLTRLFQERQLPLTVFGCALALERNPLAAEVIRKARFDVCSHGWRWVKHYELTREAERTHIARAIASLEKTVGERPLGWYCRYGPSVNTRGLLVEEGGFLYDSDAYNDELPYWVTVNGRPHLIVPYSLTNNDGKYAGWVGTSDQWFAFIKDAVDVLYREGRRYPKMMSVGLHMRLIGHPARAAGLERLLDYLIKKRGVWITRRIDIARHWIGTHPYRGAVP